MQRPQLRSASCQLHSLSSPSDVPSFSLSIRQVICGAIFQHMDSVAWPFVTFLAMFMIREPGSKPEKPPLSLDKNRLQLSVESLDCSPGQTLKTRHSQFSDCLACLLEDCGFQPPCWEQSETSDSPILCDLTSSQFHCRLPCSASGASRLWCW